MATSCATTRMGLRIPLSRRGVGRGRLTSAVTTAASTRIRAKVKQVRTRCRADGRVAVEGRQTNRQAPWRRERKRITQPCPTCSGTEPRTRDSIRVGASAEYSANGSQDESNETPQFPKLLANIRAVLFIGWTSLLALPLICVMILVAPFVYLFDRKR